MRDRFTQEEANEILLRAIEHQPIGREISREQLESIALEVGVSVEDLRAAEQSLMAERLTDEDERRIYRREQRRRDTIVFTVSLLAFLPFFVISWFIPFEGRASAIPLQVVIIAWIMWLLASGARAFQTGRSMNEQAFRHWQEARRLESREDREAPGTAGRHPVR